MASSNRTNWPSMFRSKHASPPWQMQPDMGTSPPSVLSGTSTTTTVGAGASGCSLKSIFSPGGEERSFEPKPRWNPRPEQIRILEAIFNSGMVNPPRDEIPRIRMRLQEYGQVGDANVFYWFQNRKSRTRNKLRTTPGRAAPARAYARPAPALAREAVAPPFTPHPPQHVTVPHQQLFVSPVAPTSSSSSSSDRSSGSSKPAAKPAAPQAMAGTAAMDLLSPFAVACHQQMLYQVQPVEHAPVPKEQELLVPDEPIFLQLPQGQCLSAADVAAFLGAQYMHVPAQQQPESPAGMLLGLCNDVSGPNNIGHWSCPWGAAGLGQYWSGADAGQLGLGKSNAAAPSAAVAREEAFVDATKLGLLQYGFGISTPGSVDAASAVATAGPLPFAASSPDAAAVTVASVPDTAGLTDFAASATTNGALGNNQLQGLDGLAGAAAAPASAVAVGRGAATLCVLGSSVQYTYPATHLDVKNYFGEAAVVFRYVGERTELAQVDVDQYGVTVEPLQQGAVYFVLSTV